MVSATPSHDPPAPLMPAVEPPDRVAYKTTSHSSTELSPFEVMIGENPLTAANLDIVGALSLTLTPPMIKISRHLCDRVQSHIQKANGQQKYYADTKRRAVEYIVGDKLISYRPLAPKLVPQEAVVGRPPARGAGGRLTEEYLGDYIVSHRGTGGDAQYLLKWRDPGDRST
ncbi:hypothetical protein EPH_0028900 [Eimeria praecox]|uniref:Chromo domain-containing protein n=1 Tax=Eimeria praecox TaxID=51316 RepID=U6G655_9EIME|nr:hypothetical protein EPH_0028900 [Eimeria praecox]